jgi:hypothetical protein
MGPLEMRQQSGYETRGRCGISHDRLERAERHSYEVVSVERSNAER